MVGLDRNNLEWIHKETHKESKAPPEPPTKESEVIQQSGSPD